jgi:hypothetical protein
MTPIGEPYDAAVGAGRSAATEGPVHGPGRAVPTPAVRNAGPLPPHVEKVHHEDERGNATTATCLFGQTALPW